MTQTAANQIAKMYVDSGYSCAKAMVALADASISIKDIAKIIGAMEAMGVGL